MVADERDVAYHLAGRKLSMMGRVQLERCIGEAFHNTGFPLPEDGAPRAILHHIAVDFGTLQELLDAISAWVP